MPRVLCIHTNPEYAASLANTINYMSTGYKVDAIARTSLSKRLSQVTLRDYDLIQADECLVNGLIASLGSALIAKPYCISIRGWADYTNAHNQYSFFKMLNINARTKATLSGAAGILYISEETKTRFEEKYDTPGSYIVGRTINTTNYENNRKIKSREDDTVGLNLLTVTNLRYEEKFEGVKTILRGLEPVFQKNELKYTIAGDGDYLSKLKSFLRTYPYNDSVELVGYCDKISSLYDKSDIFIYVSYLDSYATVIPEAQAAGLPVIAGEESGVPEAVGDGGLLCPPTPKGISKAVSQFLSRPELLEEYSVKSLEKIQTHNQDSAKRHMDAWDRILELHQVS